MATVEGDQPRVRPFGTAHIFEGKQYIQTGKVKDVSKQIHANPKAEICAFKNGEWLRVAGELVEEKQDSLCNLSKDLRFDELRKVLESYGYDMNVPRSGSSHYTFRKSGCMPITIPKHEPIKKVYVEMVKEIVESEAKNHEDAE